MVIIWIRFFPNIIGTPGKHQKNNIVQMDRAEEKYGQQPYIKPDEGSCKKLDWWVRANTTEHG